jgi:hypothetical protein
MDGEHVAVGLVAVDNRDLPVEDDEKVVVRIALAEEDLAGAGGPPLAETGQRLDLPVAEPRERPVGVRGLIEVRAVDGGSDGCADRPVGFRPKVAPPTRRSISPDGR